MGTAMQAITNVTIFNVFDLTQPRNHFNLPHTRRKLNYNAYFVAKRNICKRIKKPFNMAHNYYPYRPIS